MLSIEKFKETIKEKKEHLTEARKVYTGSFSERGWERDSFALLFNNDVKIEDVVVGKEPATVLDNMEFVGGNSHRVVYMDLKGFMAKYPILGKWWGEKGDSHLLASMFLRPGKLFQGEGYISLPPKNNKEVNDGLLMTLSRKEWGRLVEGFELPLETALVQGTVFSPQDGIVGKGTIRVVLPGEKPQTFVGSWKSLPEEVGSLLFSSISVLETDATYRPRASINLQEYTYWARARGYSLSPWVLEEALAGVNKIMVGEKSSIYNGWGYLSRLGIPAPDSMLKEMEEGLKGGLYKALTRWELSRAAGWRGKVSGSEKLADREILMPKSSDTVIGDTVYATRNPALPINGWVRYTVVGHVGGNVAYVSGASDSKFAQVLGGDFDGDDLVVLYRNPVQGEYEPVVNLQQWKAEGRKYGTSAEDRLARWNKERETNIGQWDILARYCADFNMLSEELVLQFSKLIQFSISLKKRVGELEVPRVVYTAMKMVGPMKELSPTYFLRTFRDSTKESREAGMVTHAEALAELMPIVEAVSDGLEAVSVGKTRWDFSRAREVALKVRDNDALKVVAKEYLEKFVALSTAKFQAAEAEDGDVRSILNRELRYLLQVEMPEFMLGLEEEQALEFSAELVKVFPNSIFWVFAVHPEFLRRVAMATFAGEKAMLVGEHSLQEGDTVIIPPYTREVEVGGQMMKLSNGVMLWEEVKTATVVKVYAKSVVLKF
jgi:hypothetical protein